MTDWIKDIRERMSMITEGKWFQYNDESTFVGAFRDHADEPVAECHEDEDATFIAHAPEDIKNLLDEVERLKEQHEGNMDALQGWYDDYQELESKNKRLLETLKDICKTLEDNGGTIDRPKRITWDVVHQVYNLARKGLEEAK